MTEPEIKSIYKDEHYRVISVEGGRENNLCYYLLPSTANVREYEKGKIAYLEGYATSSEYHFRNFFAAEDIGKKEGLAFIDFLRFHAECDLKKRGIVKWLAKTHPNFAKFLKKTGAIETATTVGFDRTAKRSRTTHFMEKNIAQPLHQPLYKLKPVRRK